MPAYLGEFEQLVLLAILRLCPKATGSAIRAAVEDGGRRTVCIGAVHTTLDRLDANGLVRSRATPMPDRTDRRRKEYAIEPAGRAAIAQAHNTWVRMTRGLKPQLESR